MYWIKGDLQWEWRSLLFEGFAGDKTESPISKRLTIVFQKGRCQDCQLSSAFFLVVEPSKIIFLI